MSESNIRRPTIHWFPILTSPRAPVFQARCCRSFTSWPFKIGSEGSRQFRNHWFAWFGSVFCLVKNKSTGFFANGCCRLTVKNFSGMEVPGRTAASYGSRYTCTSEVTCALVFSHGDLGSGIKGPQDDQTMRGSPEMGPVDVDVCILRWKLPRNELP